MKWYAFRWLRPTHVWTWLRMYLQLWSPSTYISIARVRMQVQYYDNSQLNTWLQWMARRQLQDYTRNTVHDKTHLLSTGTLHKSTTFFAILNQAPKTQHMGHESLVLETPHCSQPRDTRSHPTKSDHGRIGPAPLTNQNRFSATNENRGFPTNQVTGFCTN